MGERLTDVRPGARPATGAAARPARIAHLCLSNYYVDGMGYQENMLTRQCVDEGFETLVIASCEMLTPQDRLTYVDPGRYEGSDGAPVVRLPYRGAGPSCLTRKLRRHAGLAEELEAFAPDVMLFHGLSSGDLAVAARHAARSGAILFADIHSDRGNSARTFVSAMLHARYYRRAVHAALPQIEKVLCISLDTERFAREVYRVPEDKLEFFPLGGRLADRAERARARAAVTGRLGLPGDAVILLQTGKMGPGKRLVNTLRSLAAADRPELHLLVAGAVPEATAAQIAPLAGRPGVHMLGWQDQEGLRELLCAADVYVQPGTQSATMQQAICCGCAVILDDVGAHKPFVDGNGWLIDGAAPFGDLLARVAQDGADLQAMSLGSFEIASRLLDYGAQARRLVRPLGTRPEGAP